MSSRPCGGGPHGGQRGRRGGRTSKPSSNVGGWRGPSSGTAFGPI